MESKFSSHNTNSKGMSTSEIEEKTEMPNESVKMTSHDLNTIKRSFDVFSDYDSIQGKHLMSAENLPIALRALRQIPSESLIETFIQRYIKKGCGIDEKRFMKIARIVWMDDIAIEEMVWNAFFVFDQMQVGKLIPETMRKILLEYGEAIPEDEAESMIKKNTDKEGLVRYEALINQWKKIHVFPKPKKQKAKGTKRNKDKNVKKK